MKVIERIHNVETGEIEDIERQATKSEEIEFQQSQKLAAALAKAKVETQAKRKILLDKLGITEEEAVTLLG